MKVRMKMKVHRLSEYTDDEGFTLMEMMVVIMIIGLLAGLVIPNLLGSKTRADQKKTVADIITIENALTLYRIDNSSLPDANDGLGVLINGPEHRSSDTDSYLKRLPEDPWHHPYHYDFPGQHGDYDIYSLGADNKPGGEGANSDIGNWNVNKF